MSSMTNEKAPRKPKSKAQRVVNWIHKKPGETFGVLKLGRVQPRKGEVSDAYFAQLLETDYGIGVRLTKLVPVPTDSYAVNFHPVTEERTCECKGFLSHGHCKHADGLAALYKSGRWF